MDTLIIDIDDTLFLSPRLSRYFWKLSDVFAKVAFRLQKANVNLCAESQKFDRVIVLSGRDSVNSESTKKQLKRLGLHFDEVVLCPRTNLIGNWKLSIALQLAKAREDRVWWVDDQLEESIPTDSLRARHPSIVPMKPSEFALGKRRVS